MPERASQGDRSRQPELLSSACSLEEAHAALHYGADAVCAGLDDFSLAELDELVGRAHSLEPGRRVYAEMDTLVLGRELGSVIETLGSVADIGADGLIVQDWGAFRAARRHFPELGLHAGSAVAVRDAAGVRTLARVGFARVTVAKELTLREVRGIAGACNVEIEALVHGELCYSYGGLCLFSSHVVTGSGGKGLSANRGRCARPCRDLFSEPGRDGTGESGDAGGPSFSMPFSMKDLALPDHVEALAEAGAAGLRIEGRGRGPIYVAAVTDFYRRIIDGTLDASARSALEADIKTIFGCPWTKLYIDGRRKEDVLAGRTTGRLGVPIGTVEEIVFSVGEDVPHLRFRTSRRLELHDGLQVDLPGLYRPFGFAVEGLRVVHRTRRARHREVHEAPPGSLVEVALPEEYPQIPPGSVVFCSSSQEVKKRYRFTVPKAGESRSRVPLNVTLEVTAGEVAARARARSPATGERVEAAVTLPGPFERARDPEKTEAAARGAFARLGRTRFAPGRLAVENPGGRFVPVSVLTELRRRVATFFEDELASRLAARIERAAAELLPKDTRADASPAPQFRWSVKVERPSQLARFEAADLEHVEEVVVIVDVWGIELDANETLAEGLEALSPALGRERIRLALPVVTRGPEERGLRSKVDALRAGGWSKWEAPNPGAWAYLGVDPRQGTGEIDLTADWPLHVLNRAAALQVIEMGASRFTLSPEDGFDNMRGLLAEFGERAAVIVYQDTPLFVSATRPCGFATAQPLRRPLATGTRLVSGRAQEVVITSREDRTVVVNARPFSVADRTEELARAGAVHLRVDFSWGGHSPEEVVERWRAVREGRLVDGTHAASFRHGESGDRGLE